MIYNIKEIIKKNLILFLPVILISTSIKPIDALVTITDRTLTVPLTLISQNSSYIILFCIAFLLLYCFKFLILSKNFVKVNYAIVFFLIFKIWLALVSYFYDIDVIKNTISILFTYFFSCYLTIFSIKNERYIELYIKAITIFIFIFLFLNTYELIFNYDGVVWKGRFFGVTNHPNYIGGYLSIISPFILCQLIYKNYKSRLGFVFFIVGFLFIVIYIVMSGSRSSFFSFLLGTLYITYKSYNFNFLLKRLLHILILASIVSPIFINIGDNGSNNEFEFNRITSTQNTRSFVVKDLTAVYVDNYIAGNPSATDSTSNSYLLALARGGTVAGVFLFFIIILCAVYINNIEKYTCVGNDERIYIIPFIASTIIFLLYSIFEGVLIENFSCGQVLFIANLFFLGKISRAKLAY